jgi:hypothetical protein
LNFAPVTVNVLGLKLNVLDHSSALSLGTSQHLDIFVSYKRNQGVGWSRRRFIFTRQPPNGWRIGYKR